MRQTSNYQLPSWDSEDRILRTDFNSLTEKVDTLTEYSEETRDAVNYVAEWVENVASANPKLHKLRP